MATQGKQVGIEKIEDNQPAVKTDTRVLAAFALAVILGGGASVAIRYTYTELTPLWAAAIRFFTAAVIFSGLMFIRKVPLPRGRALIGAILFGVLSVGASFSMISWGLVETPASVYQTIAALVPIFTLFFATMHGLEKFSLGGLAGGLLAVGGIVVVFGGSIAAGVELSMPHVIAIVVGTASLAEAGVLLKLFPRNHPFATNAVAMGVGSLILFALATFAGEPRVLPSTPGVWLALIYLTLGVSVGVFLLYLFILERWTASATSYVFVLFPFVTVLLATQLLGESITLAFIAGGVLVLLGVWFGALRQPKTKEPEQERGPETEKALAGPQVADVSGCGMT